MLLRVVLDTTILISALRSPAGASTAIIDLVLEGSVILLMSYPLISEYRDVALRPEHVACSQLSTTRIAGLIDILEGHAESVEIVTRHRPLSIDPDDDRVLDVAINGHADLLITNNTKHFVQPARRFAITIADARTALFTIRKGGIRADTR